MKTSDWLTIAAIIIGPILAVQIQKLLERRRSSIDRRVWIFKTLMATRGSILSPIHVDALNRIVLEFRGRRFRNVTAAWRNYFDNLGTAGATPSEQAVVNNDRQERLTILLNAMGRSLGYNFDLVEIRRNIYSPIAHWNLEREQQDIRTKLLDLFDGKISLPIDISSVASDFNVELQKTVLELQKIYLTNEHAKYEALQKGSTINSNNIITN